MSNIPFYSKYPYIIDLGDYLSHFFSEPPSMNDLAAIERYRRKGLIRVLNAIRNIRYMPSKNEEEEVITFFLALSIAALSDPWALRKFIDYESKRTYSYLLSEEDEIIASIARKAGTKMELLVTPTNKCGLQVLLDVEPRSGKKLIECYQYRIKIPSYLTLSEKLSTDPRWKLVNKPVKEGYVYITKREAARLLENSVKEIMLKEASIYASQLSIKRVADLVEEVRKTVRKVRGYTTDEFREMPEKFKGHIIEEFFPPCIKLIRDSLIRGEHLSHHQRFALATFLLNIGASVDYVLELFKHAPDYNERIARYQIEHLAGLKGGRKKYSVYSCEKMKTLGMCVADCGTKTPVQYYLKRVRRSFKESGK